MMGNKNYRYMKTKLKAYRERSRPLTGLEEIDATCLQALIKMVEGRYRSGMRLFYRAVIVQSDAFKEPLATRDSNLYLFSISRDKHKLNKRRLHPNNIRKMHTAKVSAPAPPKKTLIDLPELMLGVKRLLQQTEWYDQDFKNLHNTTRLIEAKAMLVNFKKKIETIIKEEGRAS